MFKLLPHEQVFWLQVLFMSTHMIASHGKIREWLHEKLGHVLFATIYSIVAVVIFVPMLVIWYLNTEGFFFTPPKTTLDWLGVAVNTFGVIMLSQAVYTFSPSLKSHIFPSVDPRGDIKGITRITRYGTFMAAGIFGLGYTLEAKNLVDVHLWFPFTLFFLLGCWHQDLRQENLNEAWQEYFKKTSLVPFKAIIEGRQSFPPSNEISYVLIIIFLGIGAAKFYLL